MKQVFLSGKGQIEIIDVPVPSIIKNGILVQNSFSLISAGTEGAAITKHDGLKGLYEKILKSKDKIGQVFEMTQAQGLSSTLSFIQKKLGDFTPIGYSCSGIVINSECESFKEGDRVACMGTGFANHAEYVVIPKNLAVSLPEQVSFEQASFSAIGCIAMQGIRRLELSPGENIGVVGLGLIGQIALRLANTMGYQTYGIDIDENRTAHAREHSNVKLVLNSSSSDPVKAIMDSTRGVGLDGIVICASTKIDTVINQSFQMCRKRGRVSVVGDIGLGLERAKMYAKELEVRLSCSYGSGRYDWDYEINGRDYPVPYVRWTEKRNLEYFINLLAHRQIDLDDMISSTFEVSNAKEAYSKIKSGVSNVYGVLIDYKLPEKPGLPANPFSCSYPVLEDAVKFDKSIINLGIIGVGAYAKNVHIPNIQKIRKFKIHSVASKTGASAAVIAKKVHAHFSTSDVKAIYNNPEIDAVIISTRHSSHARFVIDALSADKHVFVEKPMAISLEDCKKIVEIQKEARRIVRVGYNRRFSPYLIQMKKAVGEGKKLLNIRVNVGLIGTHWSNTVEEGGRLMGEGVHFFDLANWMIGCNPQTVTAHFIGEANSLNPNATVTITYKNGSVANVVYTDIGHTKRGKEFYELFGNGRSVMIDDFKKISFYGCRSSSARSGKGNKGQYGCMNEFSDAIIGSSNGGADAIAGLQATAICEAAIKSGLQREEIELKIFL